jgi:hypothetical protein
MKPAIKLNIYIHVCQVYKISHSAVREERQVYN